jgi:hypothetical protein
MEPSANGRVGWVAKCKWPILLPAHPLEKSTPDFKITSIQRSITYQVNFAKFVALAHRTALVTFVVTL